MVWLNRRAAALGVALAVSAPAAGGAGQAVGPKALGALLDRLAGRIERYYATARSIVCTETVRVQPLDLNLAADGFAQEFVYDLRVSWEPSGDPRTAPEPTILRELRTINRRPPKPDADLGCSEPAVNADPLAMFLVGPRAQFEFSWAGTGRERKRSAVLLDFRERPAEPAAFEWRSDDCYAVRYAGRTRGRGRVWVDADNFDVLRIDERLNGRIDLRVPSRRGSAETGWLEVERTDVTTRYRPVAFHDPEETAMLPDSVVTLIVVTGTVQSRVRLTRRYTGYRRFVTDAHMLKTTGEH